MCQGYRPPSDRSPLQDLNQEAYDEIFSFLDLPDHLALSQVCHDLRRAVDAGPIWRPMVVVLDPAVLNVHCTHESIRKKRVNHVIIRGQRKMALVTEFILHLPQSVRTLRVEHTTCFQTERQEMFERAKPNLIKLDTGPKRLDTASLENVARKAVNLTVLSMTLIARESITGALRAIGDNLLNLRVLRLTSLNNVQAFSVSGLAPRRNSVRRIALTDLWLIGFTRLSDRNLERISTLFDASLRTLCISHCEVCFPGRWLLQNLRRLSVRNCDLGPHGLFNISQACPLVRTLDISRVVATGYVDLGYFTNLRRLNVGTLTGSCELSATLRQLVRLRYLYLTRNLNNDLFLDSLMDALYIARPNLRVRERYQDTEIVRFNWE